MKRQNNPGRSHRFSRHSWFILAVGVVPYFVLFFGVGRGGRWWLERDALTPSSASQFPREPDYTREQPEDASPQPHVSGALPALSVWGSRGNTVVSGPAEYVFTYRVAVKNCDLVRQKYMGKCGPTGIPLSQLFLREDLKKIPFVPLGTEYRVRCISGRIEFLTPGVDRQWNSPDDYVLPCDRELSK